MLKIIKYAASAIIIIGCVYLGVIYNLAYHPDDVQAEPFISPADAPMLKPGQSIKVLSWNVQFMASNSKNHFFFDNGPDPWPSKETIKKTLKDVAKIIIDENPDIILLQEVDDGSKRTHFDDQLAMLLELLPKEYASSSSSFYWKSKFVPHPAVNGAMGMKLSTISKYRVSNATRFALAAIPGRLIVETQLSIKRAVQQVEFPIEGGKNLYAMNAHLSAFAQGTNTLEMQVNQVDEILGDIEKAGSYGFIAGDFNLIPPGKAFSRLAPDSQKYYNPNGSEIKVLYDKYNALPTFDEVNGDDYKKWFSAMSTHGTKRSPDKTIDYFISTKGLKTGKHYIRSHDTVPISDHLPVVVYMTVPK